MPPGCVRSSVSPVTSFLKVIFSPLWMYDMSSRCALITSGSNCVVLKIVGVRLEVDASCRGRGTGRPFRASPCGMPLA